MVKSYLQLNVLEVGEDAPLMMEEGMMILFNDTVPQELKDIAVIHNGRDIAPELQSGDVMQIGDESFEVLFVGSKANETLNEHGHATFSFDGSTHSELPGTVCLEKKAIPEIKQDTVIRFYKK